MAGINRIAFLASFAVLCSCGISNQSGEAMDDQKSETTQLVGVKDIQGALSAGGLGCPEISSVLRDERWEEEEDAVDLAECEVRGEKVRIVVWRDNAQRDNYNSVDRTSLCLFLKPFGTNSLNWVDGDKWTVSGLSQTLSSQIAEVLGGNTHQQVC